MTTRQHADNVSAEFLVFIISPQGVPDARHGIAQTCAAHLIDAVRDGHAKKDGIPAVYQLTGDVPCTAGEHASSDYSGHPGEATPDDVSRETSSKGCSHPADEPCFGKPRPVQADANCMRYVDQHERHLWQCGEVWYQCDGTPVNVPNREGVRWTR